MQSIDQQRWKQAYINEINRLAEETPDHILDTIFFGGGTPSLMDADVVAAVVETARAAWRTKNDIEITLEANPTSVEADRFTAYLNAGVNRISLGIQSLRDADLKALGRLHSVEEARKAYDIARNTFQRVSFDLIYARQNQSLVDWKAELGEALNMASDHLSMYQLTIEDGTAFGDRFTRGLLNGLPNEDTSSDMYFVTQELCEKHGLPAYEVSNHAKPGSESQHNLIYWNYGDYAGIGPGAHGRLTIAGQKYATDTPKSPTAWLQQVEIAGHGEIQRTTLPPTGQATEYLLMGMRLKSGINIPRFKRMMGKELLNIDNLTSLGLVSVDGQHLKATQKGMALLNAIIVELLPV